MSSRSGGNDGVAVPVGGGRGEGSRVGTGQRPGSASGSGSGSGLGLGQGMGRKKRRTLAAKRGVDRMSYLMGQSVEGYATRVVRSLEAVGGAGGAGGVGSEGEAEGVLEQAAIDGALRGEWVARARLRMGECGWDEVVRGWVISRQGGRAGDLPYTPHTVH